MTVYVPARYVFLVKAASIYTGLPYAVVACQINDESGFQPNVVSSAGAEGIAQFEPGTFAAYGHGSPFNVQDAFNAYIAYMNHLLHVFGGNVRLALAGYNAGEGNYQAGLGYADTILSCAGSPGGVQVKAPGGSKPSGVGGPPGIQADDWSYYVGRAATNMDLLSRQALAYSNAIRRL